MDDRAHKSDLRYGVPFTVVLLGLALAIANSYWISLNDFLKGLNHTYMSLFSNAVFTLFVLALLNLLVRRVLPRRALRDSDLLIIYTMVVAVSTISGHRMTRFLGPIIQPYWLATNENDWQNLVWPYVPSWFTVRDMNVLSGMFQGETPFFTVSNVVAWLPPLITWSVFLIALCFTMLCINAILRRQFTERERLTYPITWLPLELGRNTGPFLRNRLLWLGFGLSGGICVLNGLSVEFPILPMIHVGWRTITFQAKPLSFMAPTRISFQPFVIGLSYFMPLDLAFSAWFFYLLRKGVEMLSGALAGGVRQLYMREQVQGAWIGLGVLALWAGRRHIQDVLRNAFSANKTVDDSDEPMSYRGAVFGLMGAAAVMLMLGARAGMSMWVTGTYLAIFWAIALGITKVRSSLGPPVHEVIGVPPSYAMVSSLGTRMLGPRNLVVLTFLFGLSRDQAAHPMPSQMEAFRIGEQAGVQGRKTFLAVLIALVVGIPATFIIYLVLSYRYGILNQSEIVQLGREGFSRLDYWLAYPKTPDVVTTSFMGVGFLITSALMALKMRFLWWPFHPIGYVLGISGGEMVYIWVPVLIGWLVKTILLRFGGLGMYRKGIPFFAGLILGDYTVGCLLSLLNAATGQMTYNMGWHPITWWK